MYHGAFLKYLITDKAIAGLDKLVNATDRRFKLHPYHRLGHSRDVFLGLAELLGEVFCGSFTGDLDKRELLAVARGVARRLTHAVLVISLHQVR